MALTGNDVKNVIVWFYGTTCWTRWYSNEDATRNSARLRSTVQNMLVSCCDESRYPTSMFPGSANVPQDVTAAVIHIGGELQRAWMGTKITRDAYRNTASRWRDDVSRGAT